MSHPKGNRLFTSVLLFFAITAGVAFISSCGSGSSAGKSSTTYVHPMFADANGNGINDYFEQATHNSGTTARTDGAVKGHAFVDVNGDGVCDYWESGATMYGQNGGMMFRDQNGNGINDYFEQEWHQGYGHDFVDLNGDGICDYAQNGTTSIFHGPGFTDSNGDGICDHWQSGGSGWG